MAANKKDREKQRRADEKRTSSHPKKDMKVKEWTVALVEGTKVVARGKYDRPDAKTYVPYAQQVS